jgi:hypothetical protein
MYSKEFRRKWFKNVSTKADKKRYIDPTCKRNPSENRDLNLKFPWYFLWYSSTYKQTISTRRT